MSQSDVTTRTDLVLRGKVAGIPMWVTGMVEAGSFAGFSGSVSIEKSLASLLDGLGTHFGGAGARLRELLGDSGIDRLRLDRLAFGYRAGQPKSAQLVATLTAGEVHCQFVLLKALGKNGGFLVGLQLRLDSKSPLENEFLSSLVGEISLGDLGVYYASEAFRDVSLLTQEVEQDVVLPSLARPETKPHTFPQGPMLSAEVLIGGMNIFEAQSAPPGPMESAVKKAEETAPAAEAPAVKEKPGAASAGLAKWFSVKKTFGPLHVQRVGLEWREAKLGLLLDAGVDLLGLSVGLLGLALRVKPGGDDGLLRVRRPTTKNIEFGLDGLELGFKEGPLQISGTLLKMAPTRDVEVEFDGAVMVRAELFTLSALGSFAQLKTGDISLFVFAVLNRELGGPPFFFVTGLAFGFGVNRILRTPAIEEVQNFPLVRGATDPAYFGGSSDPRAAMEKLRQYIPSSKGDYWLAAGVKFNSFGMIDSFALLAVSFGTQLQIALLGLSRISVPKQLPGAPPIEQVACAELAIKVTFSPASGVLAVEARLTDNSFLFTRNCRLTGGFAFYCWFAGEHAGDFVVTLGGYHARFVKPAHYPVVPRLRIHWPVSAHLSITGEAYFALTPSCLMAGGKLDAVFHAGPIRAWFYARADFLIAWKPFRYDIAVGVRIGVSFWTGLFTLKVELGASVHLWGPPFGGIAHVTLYIVSFDIPFGKQEPEKPEPLSWREFHQSFLPQSRNSHGDTDPLISTIRITSGLISEREVGDQGQKRTLRLVNAHELSFTTESVIPSTNVLLNETSIVPDDPGKDTRLGIRPMGKATLDSEHKVSLRKNGDSQNGWNRYLGHELVAKNVPYALWSSDLSELKAPTARMISDVPGGLRVFLKKREPSHGLAWMDLEKFKYEDISRDIPWEERQEPQPIPAADDKTLMNTIWNNPTVTQKRNAILGALGKAKEIESVNLRDLAANAKRMFQAMPEMAYLGQAFKRPKSG